MMRLLCVLFLLLKGISGSQEHFYEEIRLRSIESVTVNHGQIDNRMFLEVYKLPFYFSTVDLTIVAATLCGSICVLNVFLAALSLWNAFSPLSRQPSDKDININLEDEPVHIELHAPRPIEFRARGHVHHDKQTMILPPESSMGDTSSRCQSSMMNSEQSEHANKKDAQVFDPRFPPVVNKKKAKSVKNRNPVAFFAILILYSLLVTGTELQKCPKPRRQGRPLGQDCAKASDPNRMPRTPLQGWFTRAMFYDLFPFANLGWGPHKCLPYSYEAFIIASRYFPEFGAGKEGHGYTLLETQRRDVAAFFAHVIQETGENNVDLYNTTLSTEEANDCFYRGGFFNWYEGGPESDFVATERREYSVNDAESCFAKGRYCNSNKEVDFWFPCADKDEDEGNSTYRGCYFGRGPLQLSWNYNYGQLEHFLRTKKINVNLLEDPNLVLTKMNPPLAMLASLWFYMTPQPPKPSMHDVMMGNWRPSTKNRRAGYEGSVFGPTSLIINKECGGEDSEEPGGPGESRRIKAFKWFCKHLNVTAGIERTLTCKGMIEGFDANAHKYSWQPAWGTMWKSQPCDCEPAGYNGALPYYDPKFYPDRFVKENDKNRLRCVYSMYKKPEMFNINPENSPCIKHSVKIKLTRDGV